MVLLFGTWLIGGLHPIPETIYYWFRGPVETGSDSWWLHTPQWFEFEFLPVMGAMGKTALVSGPISVFCVVCSALDRWNWVKVTALSGISTFAMLMVHEWSPYDTSWVTLTLAHFGIMAIVVTVVRPLREA